MKPTLIVSILFSLLFLALNEFFFWGDWYFLVYSLIPGIFIAMFVKGERIAQIIPLVIIGSVVYGLLGMLLVEFLHVLRTDAPFNWSSILQASLINAVMCFLGGLVGIVIKGFSNLQNKV